MAIEKSNIDAISRDRKAELAFQYLTELIESGYRFTNAQMDTAVGIPLGLLPPNDRAVLREIASVNHAPLWQAVYAQFRRANENGLAYALLLDPGWIQDEDVRVGPRKCQECGLEFQPGNPGQVFCSNACGAAIIRREREAKSKPAEVASEFDYLSESEDIAGDVNFDPPGIVPFGADVLAAEIRK